jgi:hypothetical protein
MVMRFSKKAPPAKAVCFAEVIEVDAAISPFSIPN